MTYEEEPRFSKRRRRILALGAVGLNNEVRSLRSCPIQPYVLSTMIATVTFTSLGPRKPVSKAFLLAAIRGCQRCIFVFPACLAYMNSMDNIFPSRDITRVKNNNKLCRGISVVHAQIISRGDKRVIS